MNQIMTRGSSCPACPPLIVSLLSRFASLFDARTWRKVQILLPGVILAPGRRTVTSALYALGLQERGDWAHYHHVLSRGLLVVPERQPGSVGQLVQHLAPTEPLHLVIDETLERRWGAKIVALGVSGPSQLVPQPLRQGQGAALGQPDAVGRSVLGPLGVGPCPS